MKKLLIGLTVLFSFVFISNVNAQIISETYTIKEDILNSELYFNDYGTYYNGHTTNYDLLIASGKLKSFHEEAMKRGYKYYFYTSSSIFMWNDEDIKIVMSLQTLNTNNGYTLEYRLVNPNNSNYVFYWLHHWINDNKMEGLYEDSERFHLNVGIEFNTKDYNQYGLSKYHFPGFNTNADIYYYPSIANSTPYNSKLVFYSSISINGKTYNDGDVIYSQKKEPKIKYKTGFTSSEAYNVLGKVSTNFKFIDNDFITEYKNYKFKLQFGSNDFTEENIPVFSHFKLYGRYNKTDTWNSMDQYFNNNYVSLDVLDTTYDYSEGMLADASITLQLNFNYSEEDFNILYNEFKIEFYFDNTQNGYIYCYDNLTASEWEDTPKFLEDYIYYYFPSNYKYAYIVNKDSELNEGKIYYPTNSTHNSLVKLQGQYYNYTLKNYGVPLFNKIYDQDDYYSYIDFLFDNKSYILALNRIQGDYLYKSYYNPNFLGQWNTNYNPFWIINYVSVSEDTYFYAPIGYNVYFSDGSDITEIVLPNGNISIDNNNINNNYEVSVSKNDIFGIIKDMHINNNVLTYFTNVYNTIRSSKLGTYVFTIIGFSILLLILKAAKR